MIILITEGLIGIMIVNNFSTTASFSYPSSVKDFSSIRFRRWPIKETAFILKASNDGEEGYSSTLSSEKPVKTIKIKRARRMNHAFAHLYRHDIGDARDNIDRRYMDVEDFLVRSGGFSDEEARQMIHDFPPLGNLDVERHLKPKMKFLKVTLSGANESGLLSALGKKVPPQYFGARLERTIAPRHAFLMAANLPHGQALLKDDSKLLKEFLAARSSKQFSSLCNRWRRESVDFKDNAMDSIALDSTMLLSGIIFPLSIDVFVAIFQRGLMSAARNELHAQDDNESVHYKNPLVSAGDMIKLLIANGANPHELDIRGISLIHWSSG